MQKSNSKFKSDLIDRCFKLSLETITLADNLPKNPSAKVIALQVIRSSTSIGANLVEAKASSSRLEFKKYHEIALKSANETKYWLMLLKKAKLANDQTIDNLLEEATEIANMIASGILKLKNKKF